MAVFTSNLKVFGTKSDIGANDYSSISGNTASGFVPNTPILSAEVNAALRNASIGVWALFEALNDGNKITGGFTIGNGIDDANVPSLATSVRSALNEYIVATAPTTGTTTNKLSISCLNMGPGVVTTKEFNGSTALSISFKQSDFQWDSSNEIQLVGGSPSDERLKKNVVGWHYKKRITDLPVKEFDYKENDKHAIGCIAQDLREILPEAVFEYNGYLRIDEAKLIYPLIQEVRELREEVRALRELIGRSAD